MANTYTAPFAQTPQVSQAVVTLAANSITTTTPTNTALVATAGADGGLLTSLKAIPRATVTASSLVLFSSTDNGTTKHLIASVLMPAQTLATTTAIAATSFDIASEEIPLRLKAGEKLYVGSQVALAGGIVFEARWTDF